MPGSLSCEEFMRQAKAMAEASSRCGQVVIWHACFITHFMERSIQSVPNPDTGLLLQRRILVYTSMHGSARSPCS